MKALLRDNGVPTPEWDVYTSADDVNFSTYPAIVKPASEHCSLGITRDSVVMNLNEARQRVADVVRTYKSPALMEEFLDSAEYNVTVWGSSHGEDSNVTVLGISTMTYDAFDDIHDRLCTFEAKWEPASAAYRLIPAICPAPVSAELKAEIERVAIAAYRATGCRDYGRVDMRLRHGQPMALDVNTNCDVSPDSGFANAARAVGLSYADMMERIVLYAVSRHEAALARASNRYTTDGMRQAPIPAVA
jgi:D-alanine-D-alanine ligase